MAMPLVIYIVTILVTLTGAGLLLGGLDLKINANLKSATAAFYIAEAGLNHGWQELGDGDGTSDFSTVFSGSGASILFSNTSFGSGSYTVTAQGVAGSSPNRVKVSATGCVPLGCSSGSSIAAIEAEFTRESVKPSKAIITNGDLKISGNPNLMGTRGGAHSNDDMQIPGSPGVEMADGLTASNKPGGGGSLPEGIDISGTPCIGSSQCSLPQGQRPPEYVIDTAEEKDAYEAAHSSAAAEAIPKINPAEYASRVVAMGTNHYILHNDGTVTIGGTCGADGLCSGGTSVAVPAGWSFSGDKWKISGNSAADGVFYSEVKVEVSGSPGSSGSPWQATIIARDDISISGSPHLRPYPTASEDLKNHLLVTGNDLEIGGSLNANYSGGAILVHQQVKIGGGSSTTINGFIIAGDGQPTWSGDPFPSGSTGVTINEISGNPTITYNADFDCLGPGCPLPTVNLVTWRQVF